MLKDNIDITDFPEINFQTQNKEKSEKLVPLPTKHINVSTDEVRDVRNLSSKSFNERLLWASLCSVNLSDIDCYADFEVAFQEELDWLKIVNTCFLSTGNNNLFPGWAQHHASYKRGPVHLPSPLER